MRYQLLLSLILISSTQSSGDSSEEQQQFIYSPALAPPSVVYQDIYPSGHVSEENSSQPADEDLNLNTIISTQFESQDLKIPPPPRILLNSLTYVKPDTSSTGTTTHEPELKSLRDDLKDDLKALKDDSKDLKALKDDSQEDLRAVKDDSKINLKALKDDSKEDSKCMKVPTKHYSRGVLDVLLPVSRVRTFKNVFEIIRRMLSNTLMRR